VAGELTASLDSPVAIPDNDDTGATATVALTSDAVVATVEVALDIQHTYVGDLLVILEHDGIDYTLHENTGGGRDNIVTTVNIGAFEGTTAAGDWTLRAYDKAQYDIGTIAGFTITVTPKGDTPDIDPEPTGPESFPGEGGISIPDNNATGISSVARVPDGVEGTVSVSVNITHTWRGDLKVVLSHGGQSWTLADREGDSADDIVSNFNLDPAATSAAGEWRLTVSDHAGQDLGTLNSWSVVVTP